MQLPPAHLLRDVKVERDRSPNSREGPIEAVGLVEDLLRIAEMNEVAIEAAGGEAITV